MTRRMPSSETNESEELCKVAGSDSDLALSQQAPKEVMQSVQYIVR
jgi:hypothetical protein